MRDDLTGAQTRALFCLIQAKQWGKLVSKGRETAYERPWAMSVHSIAVRRLVVRGWARVRCIHSIHGTEVRGKDLVHLLGEWEVRYEATERGEQAWRRFTDRERHGLPEFAASERADTTNARRM
jgi:hypothetical protein